MAFKISQIEPVQFGDKQIEPVLDAEKKLRLQRISFQGEAAEKKADETIASCFPTDEAYVLEYLSKCAMPTKSRLVSYLIGGEETVKAIEEAYKNSINARMEGAKND